MPIRWPTGRCSSFRFFNGLPNFAVLLGLLCALASAGQPEDRFPDLDLPTLGQRADAALPHNPAEAIPYLEAIQARLAGAESSEMRFIYQENLYRLGLAQMQLFSLTSESANLLAGIPYWDEFIAEFPLDPRRLLARLNRADSFFGAEQWESALDAYLRILSLHERTIEADDLFILLQRMVASAREADRKAEIDGVLWGFLNQDYSYDIRLFCMNTLFDRALETDALDALLSLVRRINQDPAFRFDLGINLRLLNVGDRFEEAERYLEASLLFSMVLPLERLLGAVEERLINLEERLFRGQFLGPEEGLLRAERVALREQRAELAAAPRYTASLRWRQARVLQLMGRNFESYFGFRRLIREYPQHEHTEQFRYAAFLQGLTCNYVNEAIEIGETYLDNPAFLMFEKPIAGQMARLYQQKGELEKLEALADEFIHRFPFDPVAMQMTHALGHALFVRGEVDAILERFPYWAETFPDGSFIDSVHYWSGMAHLFSGDFASALTAFEELIEQTPGSVYFVESSFRRGVAFFGMGDYESARSVFAEWIIGTPEHPLQAEAHVFMGDLDAMDAEVESALANYQKVEALGGAQALIDHAYFESASLLLANKRYSEHSILLERYLETYPYAVAGADAVLRLAEADLEQGQVASAFERYRDGIERFGNLLESDHVDQLIDAWWETDQALRAASVQTSDFISRLLVDEVFRAKMLFDRVAQIGYFQENPALSPAIAESLTLRQPLYDALAERTRRNPLSPESGRELKLSDYPELMEFQDAVSLQVKHLPEEKPEAVFKTMRAEALAGDRSVLALRLLRVLNMQAGLEVSPALLGSAEIELASPATRVWIARMKSREDSVMARMLLREVIEEDAAQTSIVEALFLLASLEMESAFFDTAAQYFGQIAEDYFSHPLAPEAALGRGEALRLARRYDAAMEAYTLILNQRAWRGVIWAEATFKIGLCFLALGQEGKAQGFFERTYLAFSGYPEWAAQAVIQSADLLVKRGDLESARETYQFFLNQTQARDSHLFETISQRLQAL